MRDSCRHTTFAAERFQPALHTVPHCSWCFTSKRPLQRPGPPTSFTVSGTLPAHHFHVFHVPAVVTHSAPLAIPLHFHPPFTAQNTTLVERKKQTPCIGLSEVPLLLPWYLTLVQPDNGQTSHLQAAPISMQSDWLSIDMSYYAYEGDQVVVRCSGRDNNKIKRLMFYKDGAWLPAYYNTYIISNTRPSDSGSYYCKAKRRVFVFIDDTEETRSAWFTVQAVSRTSFDNQTLAAHRGSLSNPVLWTQLPEDRSETQLRYSFYKGGYTLRSDWDSPEFWISTIWKEDSGYYRCGAMTVSHSVSKQSQQSYIQVQSGTSLHSRPSPFVLCSHRNPCVWSVPGDPAPGGPGVEGETLVLVCSVAKGTGKTTFSCHREDTRESLGQKSQRSQRAELEIPVIWESQAGRYYGTADNAYGLIQSEAVNVTALTWDVVELRCEDKRASPAILCRFYHEDVALGNTSAPSGGGASFNRSVTARHCGSYACEADNGLGAQRGDGRGGTPRRR
ncbi:hypothetical protein Celaphus_00001861 [Cervus elaphus hippelaphus]|uniref:Ig-like domain-containing protein n=1 Tax=Cervus elaphus hippelaphus TaxID=46360 RepID=A0A212CFZ3_CEREH|nr:hypothetical protein Celaphus_00001861 [Cervus elaphus hippelaphus]